MRPWRGGRGRPGGRRDHNSRDPSAPCPRPAQPGRRAPRPSSARKPPAARRGQFGPGPPHLRPASRLPCPHRTAVPAALSGARPGSARGGPRPSPGARRPPARREVPTRTLSCSGRADSAARPAGPERHCPRQGSALAVLAAGRNPPLLPCPLPDPGGGQGVTAGRRGAQLFLLVFVVPEEALLRARPPGSSRLAGGRHVAAISWPTGCAARVRAGRALLAPGSPGCGPRPACARGGWVRLAQPWRRSAAQAGRTELGAAGVGSGSTPKIC